MAMHYTNIGDLAHDVSEARAKAHAEAKRECPTGTVLRSRGAYLIIPDPKGGDPIWGDGLVEFKSTWKQVLEAICTAQDEGATNVYIEGGFNAAENVNDMNEGIYDPWVSEWSLCIWTKE